MDWQRFVLDHGWRAHLGELAPVLGRTPEEIARVRQSGACRRLKKGLRFAELFALWHGRPPRDDEWPAPRKSHRGDYAWQPPELALLASLVGTMSKQQIARVLTQRLRRVTGDRRAARSADSVQNQIGRIGLVSTDVVGGITAKSAGKELGSYYVVLQAIEAGRLRARKVGRLWVIPHAAWATFMAGRVAPPRGYVQLSTIRSALGINSDAKLPEYASLGYIPTAVLCNVPAGSNSRSSVRGAWFVDRRVARQMVADRRAGKPMPWFGKPNPGNLKQTWKLLQARRHPAGCPACAQIWGRAGFPCDFEDYARRYPPLAFGAKRHLTRQWDTGLTTADVARLAKCGRDRVLQAIRNGVLETSGRGRRLRITRTEAQRWKARHCPSGSGEKSWIALSTARRLYGLKLKELRALIAAGELKSRIGSNGPQRGRTYVPRHQCMRIRERLGYTVGQAARRAGVSPAQMRTLLAGVNWRGAEGIPLDTVKAAIKRLQSQQGSTITQAAKAIGMTVAWVKARIADGTVRVKRAPWDARRLYLTKPMIQRLLQAKRRPIRRTTFSGNWLFLNQAADEAGVSTATMLRWIEEGRIGRRPSPKGWRYSRRSVRACARRHWSRQRFKRAEPPAWLLERSA